MNISYTAWEAYTECPKKFFLEHIKKAPPTTPSHDYYKLYGLIVQKFFEVFCNRWRFRTPYIFPEIIHEKLVVLWEDLLKTVTVDWDASYAVKQKDEILDEAYTDVCIIMDSLNQNYFLNSRSEVEITIRLKDSHSINGIIDFVHTDYMAGNSVVIFDGKGTRTVGKNIDKNQLLFYALLYYLSTKILPSTLGFFYYKLNVFSPLFFNQDVLNEFRIRLSADIKAMTTCAEYVATPCAKSCRYCLYLTGCMEGQQAKSKRARPSKLKELDKRGEEESGILEFGLD